MCVNLKVVLFEYDSIPGSGCSTPNSRDGLRAQIQEDRAQGRAKCVEWISSLPEEDRTHWKKILLPHVLVTVEKLHETLGHRQYTVHFNAQTRRGKAQPGGAIFLDYGLLIKSDIEIMQTLGHEWGHLALGHVVNPHVKTTRKIAVELAEQEADFYSGMVLALLGYEQQAVEDLLTARVATIVNRGSYHSDHERRAPFVAAGFKYGLSCPKENVPKKKPTLNPEKFCDAFQEVLSEVLSEASAPKRVRSANKWF